MSFLENDRLISIGFKSLGNDVKISDKAVFYNAQNISIGDHTRIDDFCILSAGEGGIYIGRYIHIACFCSLIGKGRIEMQDFSGLSSRTSIYSSSDDYSGEYLTNPTVPERFRNTTHGNVFLGKHVVVGAGSIILPNVIIENGVAIGAKSLVTKNCDSFNVYVGTPAKLLKSRANRLDELEAELLRGDT